MTAKNTIDLYRRYTPTPSQTKFLKSTARGRLFSSGFGSGKSKTGCRESIAWAVRYAGSRNGIFRLTAEQLRKTTMVTFWKEMSQIGFKGGTPEQVAAGKAHYSHNKSDKEIRWWNGSVTLYGHLEDQEGLGSLELSSAFIDEGSEVPTSIYQILYGSRLRWHLPDCNQQEEVEAMIAAGASDEEVSKVPCDCPRGMWVCTNPGDSGYLRLVIQGRVDGWDWIPAKPGDNPYNGPDYYAQMDRLAKIHGEHWMAKYRDGSWESFEGQRFGMFDRDTHVLNTHFRPTVRHIVVEGWDFGHRETFVTWMAYIPDRSEPVVVFHELQMNEVQEPKDVADEVKRIRASYGIKAPIALGDPAGVAASTFSAVSPIMAYAGLGIHISPCKKGKSPTSRADLLTAFLNERKKMLDGTEWPGIVFTPNCLAVVDSIINLRWKPQTSKLGEDPREQFIKKDDHGFDALGYGLVGVPPPDLPKQREPWKVAVNSTAQEAFKAG